MLSELFSHEISDNLTSVLDAGSEFLTTYGWYLLGILVLYGLFFREKINKYLDVWYQKREEKIYAAKYHKDPDMARARLEGFAAARERMQEEHNRKSREAEQKRKEKEEQKRAEKVQMMEQQLTGHRLGSSSMSHKPEYNPLMGDGSTSTYRPPKRACCKKGGGCG